MHLWRAVGFKADVQGRPSMTQEVSSGGKKQGEEAKMEATTAPNTGGQKKSSVPFQRDQLTRVFEVLGTPSSEQCLSLLSKAAYHPYRATLADNLTAARVLAHVGIW
jgi:hypothetical protein